MLLFGEGNTGGEVDKNLPSQGGGDIRGLSHRYCEDGLGGKR
jgi:hypothetical protein